MSEATFPRVGVFSDAHGNLAAFRQARAILAAERVTMLRFLGDSIGYIPDVRVARELIADGTPCTLGNHEAMMLQGNLPPEKDAVYRLGEARRDLAAAEFETIAAWPRRRTETLGGVRCLFLHGSPADDVFDYVYPDTPLEPLVDGSVDVVFMGNTHRPFVRECEGTLFVNVGSCGLPRQEDGHATVCVFDCAARRVTIRRFSIAASARDLLRRDDLDAGVRRLLERSLLNEED